MFLHHPDSLLDIAQLEQTERHRQPGRQQLRIHDIRPHDAHQASLARSDTLGRARLAPTCSTPSPADSSRLAKASNPRSTQASRPRRDQPTSSGAVSARVHTPRRSPTDITRIASTQLADW